MPRIETIGDAMLYLGDCREILPTLKGIAGVLTDPPYGMDYTSGHATDRLWKAGRKITNDNDCSIRDAALALIDCPAIVFGTHKVAEPPGTRQHLIWDQGPALGMGALDLPWKPSHSELYILGKGFVGGRNWGSVLYHHPTQATAKNGRRHPNEKPVGLLERLLRWMPPGLICDPFMGSGSTGEAALKAGRSFIGIEIEPTYFEISCERLRKITRQPDMIGWDEMWAKPFEAAP
jgi:DNA modification methylase